MVKREMHDKRATLLDRLDESIALMSTLRTPDPVSTAAYDALKQARALIAQALDAERRDSSDAACAQCAAA